MEGKKMNDSEDYDDYYYYDEDYEGNEDQFAAKGYNLGTLHSKVIKKVFCCLTENQKIGGNTINFISFIVSFRSFYFNLRHP